MKGCSVHAGGLLMCARAACRWMIVNKGFPVDQFVEGPLHFFIYGVAILVVSIPEGLPLAVTMSLAYR